MEWNGRRREEATRTSPPPNPTPNFMAMMGKLPSTKSHMCFSRGENPQGQLWTSRHTGRRRRKGRRGGGGHSSQPACMLCLVRSKGEGEPKQRECVWMKTPLPFPFPSARTPHRCCCPFPDFFKLKAPPAEFLLLLYEYFERREREKNAGKYFPFLLNFGLYTTIFFGSSFASFMQQRKERLVPNGREEVVSSVNAREFFLCTYILADLEKNLVKLFLLLLTVHHHGMKEGAMEDQMGKGTERRKRRRRRKRPNLTSSILLS